MRRCGSVCCGSISIEIGKGFGPFDGNVWRIGLMGESSKAEYLLALLSSLEGILPDAGV